MRITSREIIIGIAGFVTALIIVAGGLWWHDRTNHQQLANKQTADTQAQSDSSGVSGLSVGDSSNLGQLGASGAGGQSQNSGKSSNSSNGVDPSTFAQYNKYQGNKDALFADIKKGSGDALTSGKKGNIYYKVWLTNGALVDQSPVSSAGQPQPFSFTMGAHQVIPGLEEGTYGMQSSGERLVIVPPAVGYGAQGQGSIPPNAVLVFDVQLIGVQ